MGFFKPTTTKPTVKILEQCMPCIVINKDALTKMKLFIEGCSDEIGWLGTAYHENGLYIIDDVFLFDQEVHSATTEITTAGLSKFAEEILKKEDGMDIWNNLKVWGHSHVNMATFASSQDDAQMVTFSQNGHDWFIRIIGNKKGEIRVDLYDYKSGIIYSEMPWNEELTEEERAIKIQIAKLEKLLALSEKQKEDKYGEIIKGEIKEKVKKKSYGGYGTGGYYGHGGSTYIQHGGVTYKVGVEPDEKDNKKNVTEIEKLIEEREKEKKTTTTGTKKDVIEKYSDIYDFLDQEALMDIVECETIDEVEDILEIYGYKGVFSDNDKGMMMQEADRSFGHMYLNKEYNRGGFH